MNPLKLLKPILAVLAAGGMMIASQAAAVTVTSLADSGPGTLRQAIAASASGGTIDFAVTGTIRLTSGELDIGRNLTILGPGPTRLIIDGNQRSRVFHILTSATVSVSGLTISNGLVVGTNYPSGETVAARGGGILNEGNLSLTSCRISGNVARGGNWSWLGNSGLAEAGGDAFGGGIAEIRPASGGASLNLTGCLVDGNVAQGGAGDLMPGSPGTGGDAYGGGIWYELELATFVLNNCSFTANSAIGGAGANEGGAARGGAVSGYTWLGKVFGDIYSCTVSGNSCRGGNGYDGGPALGGGLYGPETIRLADSIIAGNIAMAGVASSSGVSGSVQADIGSAGGGTDSYIYSLGFNLIGQTNGTRGWQTSDLVGSASTPLDPLLTPLQDNGGPIPTMAPLSGSAAIDNGKSFGLTTDQRGLTRPLDLAAYNNASGGDGADIGAVEVQWEPVDIDLRAHDGTGIISIACEPPVRGVPMTSPLRIRKGTTTYGIILVDTNASNASRIRIPTATGIKAWAKLL